MALTSNLAFADITSTAFNPHGDISLNGGITLDPVGDTFSNAIAGFGPGGGAFLTTGSPTTATFPGTESMGDSLGGANVSVSSAIAVSGLTETITLQWSTDDFSNLIPTGTTIGGGIVDTISFEMGEGNAGDNPIEWSSPTPFTIDSSVFELLGAGGGVLFTGEFFVTNTGSGFSGVTFIGAGGADLSGFGISGGRATIVVTKVPEPTSFALISLVGFGLAVRRRR